MTKESSHEFGASVESVKLGHDDQGKASRVFESPVGPIIISHDVPTFSIPVHDIQPSDIRIETYTEGVIVSSDVKVEPFYEIKDEPSEDRKVETYTCDFCDKVFTWKGNLEMHLLRIHQGEGKFNCSLCGKQFIHENSLKIHKRLHATNFEEVEQSNGNSEPPQVVVKVENGSTNGGLQKTPPSQAHTKLFSISSTNPPKTKESDIKPEEKDTKTYDYHSVSKVTPEFYELDAKIKAKVIEKGQNEFTCKDCDFFTKNRCNMYNHVEAKHVQHDGVKCQICNKMCSTRLSHRVHLIVGHKVQVRAKKQ